MVEALVLKGVVDRLVSVLSFLFFYSSDVTG